MYRKNQIRKTSIHINNQYEGESIEQKVQRIISNKEPISDGATPLIYTERKDGVKREHDIRTDRFEVAIEAMDKVTKSHQAKREGKAKIGEDTKEKLNLKGADGGGETPVGESGA